MADAKVQIGLSTDFLEGTSVDTPAGDGLFREGVVISDPTVAAARAVIVNAAPAADAYGLAVRVAGQVALDAASLIALENITVNVEAGASIAVSNLPATYPLPQTQVDALKPLAVQPVSGTVGLDAASLAALETINATVSGSVSVSNFPATQAISGSVTVSNLPVEREAGQWAYASGIAGAATAPGRVLQITAAAPRLLDATFSINGGAVITIPAGQALTVEPKGNLANASIVFTGTASYFIEYVT
jgi:hypothetical protein